MAKELKFCYIFNLSYSASLVHFSVSVFNQFSLTLYSFYGFFT